MIKLIVALTLSSICVMACAQAPPAQSETAGQAASPAPAQPEASKPVTAAATCESTSAAPAQPPSKPEPAPPPAPTFREVTIPAGTSLSVTLLSTVASNTSKVEDPIKGSIAKDVTISGVTALPVGTQILGSVTEAAESGRVKGKASVAFRFDRLVVNGETVRVQTANVQREAAADTKSDVKKGGARRRSGRNRRRRDRRREGRGRWRRGRRRGHGARHERQRSRNSVRYRRQRSRPGSDHGESGGEVVLSVAV